MADRIYCSEVARTQQAELAGTAVQVEVWLLLEYPRPWKPKALEDNDLGEEVKFAFQSLEADAAAAGVKLRIQFIKQAASADIEHPRVFLADVRPGHERLLAGTLEHYRSMASLDFATLMRGELPRVGERVPEPIYLVCTNGQRDLCCARFGLPLYEALRQRFDRRIWQTTHVGGHRYAPNLVCLPTGLTYGFVAPEIGEALVHAHDAGRVDYARLRGRSALAPAAQAAEAFVGRALGQGERSFEPQAETGEETSFAFGDGRVTVAARRDETPVLASCGKDPKPATRFELVSLESD